MWCTKPDWPHYVGCARVHFEVSEQEYRIVARFKIDNQTARGLWLATHGLGQAPRGAPDTLSVIDQLGFVQLDSIQVVSRAHHHILWSRDQTYREPMLDPLMRRERQVFEHFTHDASVLPMDMLPIWQRQFQRMKAKVGGSSWFGKYLDPDLISHVTRRIADEGPLCTKSFDTRIAGEKTMWKRPPHKMVLDYLWYAGVLATSHREGFTKYYDLAERVFPQDVPQLSDDVQITQLCRGALDRIGFGSLSEIRKFWDACDVRDVQKWAVGDAAQMVEVDVQGADGSWTPAWAAPDIEDRVARLKSPTSRLRIINPFDPAIRDRARTARLFGFDYTVEMFVPEAKRKWGYYVYPLLEGGRFVGRVEVKGNRKAGTLTLSKFWTETERLNTSNRRQNLAAELARFAKLAGLNQVVWRCD